MYFDTSKLAVSKLMGFHIIFYLHFNMPTILIDLIGDISDERTDFERGDCLF